MTTMENEAITWAKPTAIKIARALAAEMRIQDVLN
jgi:hypothetical protein